MKNFVKKWNGKGVEDWHTSMSKEAKNFVTSFRNALKKDLPDDYTVKIKAGHYCLSGFITKDAGRTVYISYSIPRMEYPVSCYERSPMLGVLVRYAKDDTDFRGEQNHFCNIAELPQTIKAMLG